MARYIPSKQEIQREIIRCGNDPVYFIRNYVKITHPQRGLIPFILYPFQEDTLRQFEAHRLNIVLKSRQMGLSTLSSAYVAWFMLFQKNKEILAMATKLKVAKNLVRKVATIFQHLPAWLLNNTSDIKNASVESITLQNGSKFSASTKSEDAGRSEALSLLILDEAAHIEGMDDIWKSIGPTITLGGRCIALSSPNGVGNWFYQFYSDGEDKKNDFNPIKLHWRLHPERDDAWFANETRNMSERDVAQEYSAEFLASGRTLIEARDIKRLEDTLKSEPIERAGFDRNLWIWEHARPEFTYLLVADVARGDGEDYSAFQVLKLENMEVVAEYQGKVKPDMFAEFLYQVGKKYNSCMIVVENNNIGWTVANRLAEVLFYPNLYYSTRGAVGEYIDPLAAETNDKAVPGFNTSHTSRPNILAKLEEYIRMEVLKTHSIRVINEMRTFVYKDSGKVEAAKGYNDDLIMSLAIACWIRDTALVANKKEIEWTKAMLNSFYVSSTKLDTKIEGQIGFGQGISGRERMRVQKEARGQVDFSRNEVIPNGRIAIPFYLG